jgi:SSS family solute:Na+ symporter
VARLLPVGVTGLVMAGLIAAIMSTIDSTLNSASTLITVDFIQPNRPNMTPKEVGRFGRIVTAVLMIVAAVWAPVIREFPDLWNYIQSMLSYLVPPVVAIFLLGVFWQRTNGTAAFYTLIGGHALSLVVFLFVQDGILFNNAPIDLHFTIVAGLLTALSTALCAWLSVNVGEAPAEEKLRGLTWSGREAEVPETLAWYEDYRVQSVLVVGLTVAMLIVFW